MRVTVWKLALQDFVLHSVPSILNWFCCFWYPQIQAKGWQLSYYCACLDLLILLDQWQITHLAAVQPMMVSN